ncbi:MAG TPA: ATP-binding cassette domain-containing protein [Spirochaetales bacterium]|nr:ATP-binding cassette domain-containing protein [Spirochaetales bacterium]
MVEVSNLAVEYPKPDGSVERAVDGFSLSVPKGQSCAIIGRSGCGKTSLLNAIAGLIPPAGGSVRVAESLVTGPRKGTAMVLQDLGLFPWKTARDNVALGALAWSGGASGREQRRDARAKAAGILDRLGVPEIADKYPAELSGGQRQRVAIGRALAAEPDLLLLDEPSASLDAMTKEAFQHLVLTLSRAGDEGREMTVVLVTHDVEEAAYLADTIVVMDAGRARHVVKNPLERGISLRERLEFYEFCLELRRRVGGGE